MHVKQNFVFNKNFCNINKINVLYQNLSNWYKKLKKRSVENYLHILFKKRKRMPYTNIQFEKFYKENKLSLTNDYSDIYVKNNTVIEGKCMFKDCNKNFSKTYDTLKRKTNFYCYDCNNLIKKIKNEEKCLDKNKVIYNNKTLEKFTLEKQIILTEDYSNINVNSKTIIYGQCTYENCNEFYSKTYQQLYLYSIYCKKCTKINALSKYKQTCIEKYGCENAFQNKVSKQKIKETNLKKYGFECAKKSKQVQDKYKTTCLEKYGCENVFQYKEIKEKSRKTNMEKYGVEFCMQNVEIREKSKEICLEKYGVENPSQNQEIKEKIKKTNLQRYGFQSAFQNKDIKQKQKNTCLEKYGVENVFQNREIKEKIRDTNIENYGVENPVQNKEIMKKIRETTKERYGTDYASQNPQVKQKIKETCLKNYGVEYVLKSKEVREKGIQTNLEKYGKRHPMQNAEYSERISKSSYSIKPYKMPSGKVLMIQGFENFGLDDLLNKEKIDEGDIINDRKKVPEVWYIDCNMKLRRHYVDFYIPSQNRCIEIKSSWTFEINKEKVLAKQKAAIEKGMIYEIWIYNEFGKRLDNDYL